MKKTAAGGWLAAVIAGLILAIAGQAFGAAPVVARQWPMKKDRDDVVIETTHYTIRTDLGAEAGQAIATHQEVLFLELYRRMGEIKKGRSLAQKFKVLAVAKKERYLTVVGKDHDKSQGMFMPSDATLACWGAPEKLDMVLETLRHEGTHQFVHLFISSQCPVWFNEGMATLYEHGRFANGRLDVEQMAPEYLYTLKKAIAAKELIPLPRFIATTHDDWSGRMKEGTPGHIQYAQAWALTYFLAYADGGKYQGPFQQYITLITKGQSLPKTWETIFGADYAPLEAKLTAWVQAQKTVYALDCRNQLRMLGCLLAKGRARPDLYPDLKTFRQNVIDEKFGRWTIPLGPEDRIASSDKQAMAKMFRCDMDLRPGDDSSYELVPQGEALPVVRCRHHGAVVLETAYDAQATESGGVSVVSRPAGEVPPTKSGPARPGPVKSAATKAPATKAPAAKPAPAARGE